MKKILKSIGCVCFVSSLFFVKISNAASNFEIWKESFYQEAKKEGISSHILNEYVPQMQFLQRIVKLDTNKPVYLKTFFNYLETRLTETRINQGKKMLLKYPTWLNYVSNKYGVPKEYIVAFWGMETNYGSYMGKVDMLNSLATLAYHPRRRRFFTNELIAYLKILESEPTVAPQKGSWDGGFGNFQFMPSTFLAYAIDGDNNGRRDVVRNLPDAFSSAANYLSSMGWNKAEPWGREVVIPDNLDWSKLGEKRERTVLEWQKLGIRPKHENHFPKSELNTMAQLKMPMGVSGPVFLAYPNFKIIMRWNRMEMYAMSVGLLADILKNEDKKIDFRQKHMRFKTSEIIEIQNKLNKMGYHVGKADGYLGPKTRKAIRQYQQKNSMIPDGYPNKELIDKLYTYKL